VSLFFWRLPFDLSSLGAPAGSYTTAGIALGVTEALKLPHHVKVETRDTKSWITMANTRTAFSEKTLFASKLDLNLTK